ncbi:MAG TPA: metallophosphoesterase [Tepidisphaeraceae bacterium]|jgi:hypothetical protein|nr:metallophosphoesterase [Tepidisphaeraceae bacterium]
MPERPSASQLLARARDLLDAPNNSLLLAASHAWQTGFVSGGQWMTLALQVIRQESSPPSIPHLQSLGIAKYALASFAGMTFILAAFLIHQPLIALLSVIAFYAVEAQMIFLFPLALDGQPHIFRESRRWTLRAGGTLAVMRIVLPLAATMILGGFLARGFVRSWCLGCLAICLWYEDLRHQEIPPALFAAENKISSRTISSPIRQFNRFQFGVFAPLHIRRERIDLGLTHPATLLYASDLHLGWWWTNPVIPHLLSAAKSCTPDAIILGGDLADRRRVLPLLHNLITNLAKLSPVFALAGNHDHCLGLHSVRAAAQSGGATWMNEDDQNLIPLRPDVLLSASLYPPPATSAHRILCTHNPAIFPAACTVGYRLTLAGHLHGGQCVLFNRQGQLYPGSFFTPWTGLRFTRGQSTMLVSRGAADTFPIRWNCPREVIVCDLI